METNKIFKEVQYSMLTQKVGWKIIQKTCEEDRETDRKELMVIYDQEEAKKILEFFADSEKYRKDPFIWKRETHARNDIMYIKYADSGSHREIVWTAKKINFVEEES